MEEVGDGVEEAGESVGEGEGEDPGEVGEEECEEERDVDEVVEPATKVSPAEIHWRVAPDLGSRIRGKRTSRFGICHESHENLFGLGKFFEI